MESTVEELTSPVTENDLDKTSIIQWLLQRRIQPFRLSSMQWDKMWQKEKKNEQSKCGHSLWRKSDEHSEAF